MRVVCLVSRDGGGAVCRGERVQCGGVGRGESPLSVSPVTVSAAGVSRDILEIYGSGMADAPVWRAGNRKSGRLKTPSLRV